MKPKLRASKVDLTGMTDKSSKLLGEIHEFLDECESDENILSDTWRKTLDLDDPIQRSLVEMGDTGIGDPILDLNVLGVNISSHYVNSIVTASKIIAHLDSIGIKEPTILEIGSGIGLLGVALKKWYGSKVTLIFADLPETLEHQSFLLLSTFQNEKYSFKHQLQMLRLPSAVSTLSTHIN